MNKFNRSKEDSAWVKAEKAYNKSKGLFCAYCGGESVAFYITKEKERICDECGDFLHSIKPILESEPTKIKVTSFFRCKEVIKSLYPYFQVLSSRKTLLNEGVTVWSLIGIDTQIDIYTDTKSCELTGIVTSKIGD